MDTRPSCPIRFPSGPTSLRLCAAARGLQSCFQGPRCRGFDRRRFSSIADNMKARPRRADDRTVRQDRQHGREQKGQDAEYHGRMLAKATQPHQHQNRPRTQLTRVASGASNASMKAGTDKLIFVTHGAARRGSTPASWARVTPGCQSRAGNHPA